jgi:hypothetical protein
MAFGFFSFSWPTFGSALMMTRPSAHVDMFAAPTPFLKSGLTAPPQQQHYECSGLELGASSGYFS